MKLEIKILLGLTAAALIPLIAAIVFLRPEIFVTAALIACGVITVLVAWRLLASTIVSDIIPPTLGHFTPSKWPQRTGDPEKLVGRLVSATEELLTDIDERKGIE